MRVRLLNASIYTNQGAEHDPMHDPKSYPVIVNAEQREYPFEDAVKVPYSELDRVFPIVFPWGDVFKRSKGSSSSEGLSWWNDPCGAKDAPQVSYEIVSPLDYWNKLKGSRPVGDVVPAGYL
jgi:hypothetical protein